MKGTEGLDEAVLGTHANAKHSAIPNSTGRGIRPPLARTIARAHLHLTPSLASRPTTRTLPPHGAHAPPHPRPRQAGHRLRCTYSYPLPLALHSLPPPQIKPRVNASRTGVETAAVKHSLNPFDELSLEEAARLRERRSPAFPVTDVLAVTAGPAKSADALRTALALGADRALHIKHEDDSHGVGGLEPLAVAKLLAAIVRREDRNLVLLGKQSIDDDSGQTGGMLAGLLGWGQATQISKIELEEEAEGGGGWMRVTKEVDGGTETVRGALPLVLTTDLRLNEPRFATLPNIMKAKKKELTTLTPEELGVDVRRRLKTVKVEEPPPRKGGGKVESVDGMIARLKELGAI